jgi:very-short-patch-repair endonuclease
MLKTASDFSMEDLLRPHRFTPHDSEASLSKRFKDIKTAWDANLPIYIEHHKQNDTLRFDPYFYDWVRLFSPIESNVWNEIRCSGIPLFPQFPACGYFLDFANPIVKIAIECDGAAYHDVNKDFVRDTNLIADGWMIFRVTGRECNLRVDDAFYTEYDDEENKNIRKIEDYFFNTSDGVIHAMQKILFPRVKGDYRYDDICVETLRRHLSKAHDEIDFYSLNYDLKARLPDAEDE